MLLEAVERHVGIEQRIGVIEASHETEREAVLGECVNEGTAELLMSQRIAERMSHCAGFDATAGNVPQLLQADRVLLRLAVLAQLELVDQPLGEIAAHPVAEDRDLGVNVHAWLVVRFLLAVLANTAIACTDTNHTDAVGQHLLTSKARK